MDFSNTVFKRKFSLTMYKDLKILLAKMTFTKDFVTDTRGDMYPVIDKSDDCKEKVENNLYFVESGSVTRLITQFFPFATYELEYKDLNGSVGFAFDLSGTKATICVTNNGVVYTCGENSETVPFADWVDKNAKMRVSCRPGAFDIYFDVNGSARFFHTFSSEEFEKSNHYSLFSNSIAALTVSGKATIISVASVVDCGISQADMRPIRYENGDVMIDDGKVFLSLSIRMEVEMFQGIFSWVPGTSEFELTGALFYDTGDGRWCGDVAASILYHREKKAYYMWVCAFNSGHILGHAIFDGDIRYGVNVVDITLMEKAQNDDDITVFLAMPSDEDPDFYYDEKSKKWYMAICRRDPVIKKFRYVFFESDNPFENYKYIGKGLDGHETGGSFVKIKGERHFICGNSYDTKSNYRIYSKDGMQNAKFDFCDGGARGWGTIMPIKLGTRTRHFWITFDRHGGSNYTWSYGNVYGFEADI